MGKRSARRTRQFRKHRLEGEDMKQFMIRHAGNIRPEQKSRTGATLAVAALVGAPLVAEGQAERVFAAAQRPQEAPEPVDESQREGRTVEGGERAHSLLSSMTVPDLKKRAKAQGVKGYSTMRKPELISVLS